MSQGSSLNVSFNNLDASQVLTRGTIAELRLMAGSWYSGQTIILTGRQTFNDRLASVYVWDETSLASDDGDRVIKSPENYTGRWIRVGFLAINDPVRTSGVGDPNGRLSSDVGGLYTRTDGGPGSTLYVKESGTGNTGWVAK